MIVHCLSCLSSDCDHLPVHFKCNDVKESFMRLSSDVIIEFSVFELWGDHWVLCLVWLLTVTSEFYALFEFCCDKWVLCGVWILTDEFYVLFEFWCDQWVFCAVWVLTVTSESYVIWVLTDHLVLCCLSSNCDCLLVRVMLF